MGTRVLQVASSFTSIPIARTLRPYVVEAGIADDLNFAQYAQMAEYMLGGASDSQQIVGTVVLLRTEDWLREDVKSPSFDASSELGEKARQKLRARVDEFASQLGTLAQRGKPVWFLACPSTGWISDKYKLEGLFRTYTNLLGARVRNLPQVTTLCWPASLFPIEASDRSADRLGQMPFTTDAFNQLGNFLGQQVVRSAPRDLSSAETVSSSGSGDLAAYLAGLRVHVRLVPVDARDRAHVDRLLRTAAAFSLTGEKPDISEAEVDAFLEPGRSMLVAVSDRLSDHGPSGLLAFRSTVDSLIVDSMALSCPVLGKQVEYAVLIGLAKVAAFRQSKKLVFEYRPSDRNQPMRAFLQSVAEEQSNTFFVLPADQAESRVQKTALAAGTWTLELPK
jgi:hypothetical protein